MNEQLVTELAHVRRLLDAYRSAADGLTLAADDDYWNLCGVERKLCRLLEKELRTRPSPS